MRSLCARGGGEAERVGRNNDDDSDDGNDKQGEDEAENTHEFVIKETVAYDVSESILANKAAERNAKKRLANLLSQAVLTELYHSNFDWIK